MTPKSIALLSAVCLFLVSCGKSGGDSGTSGGRDGSTASEAQADFTKPYLTETKVEGVLKVMKDDPTFWKEYSKGWNPLTVKSKMADLDAHAKKLGFSDFQDYANSVTRVWTGMGLIAMQKAQAEALKSFEKVPADATPEMKKMMEDQKKAMQESMAEMNDGQKLNEADRKLIEKYSSQLEAAAK
jgi:hypothetical protein